MYARRSFRTGNLFISTSRYVSLLPSNNICAPYFYHLTELLRSCEFWYSFVKYQWDTIISRLSLNYYFYVQFFVPSPWLIKLIRCWTSLTGAASGATWWAVAAPVPPRSSSSRRRVEATPPSLHRMATQYLLCKVQYVIFIPSKFNRK